MSKPKTVRLFPVPGVSVYPWPSVEFDATPEEAEALLAHVPSPFTTEPPKAPSPPETAAEAPDNP